MTSEIKKAVLIIRVSDPRQEREGLSLDNQEQSLRAYAKERGIHIEREFRFQESADNKLRKNFQLMVSFVKARSEVTCIIGYRVDRLTRNYHDHVLLDELRLNHKKELHFVHDRLVISERTVGREITEWDTKVYLAKSYLNRLKEDAYTTISFKLSRGEWPSRAPFGYRNSRVDNRSVIEIEEPQAQAVKRAFELYASGAFSMERVRRTINNEFNLKLSKGNVDHVLKNPFYHGDMLINGRSYPHVHTTLITKSLFGQVQSVKEGFKKKSFKYSGLPFTYRGLFICSDCGCRVTPERKRKSGTEYAYYHCTQYHGKHGAEWITEKDIDSQIQSLLETISIPLAVADALMKKLAGSELQRLRIQKLKRDSLIQDIQRLEKRLIHLYDDRLDEIISTEQYIERSTNYKATLEGIRQKLTDEVPEEANLTLNAQKLIHICTNASKYYAVAKLDEKRWILKLLLQNCQLKGKRLLWELKKPFDTVFDCGRRQSWLRLEDMFRHGELYLDECSNDMDEFFKSACISFPKGSERPL